MTESACSLPTAGMDLEMFSPVKFVGNSPSSEAVEVAAPTATLVPKPLPLTLLQRSIHIFGYILCSVINVFTGKYHPIGTSRPKTLIKADKLEIYDTKLKRKNAYCHRGHLNAPVHEPWLRWLSECRLVPS